MADTPKAGGEEPIDLTSDEVDRLAAMLGLPPIAPDEPKSRESGKKPGNSDTSGS